MNEMKLVAERRDGRGKGPARRLRADGKVPATIYGLGAEAQSVAVPARALDHILSAVGGANTLITLEIDGESSLTLARQVSRNPVRGTILHVDFIRVRRDQAVQAEVPVHLVGEATGVRDGGVLEHQATHVTVSARPGAIPSGFEIDITNLGLGDHVYARDLALPAGVELVTEGDTPLAMVSVPRGLTAAVAEGDAGAEAGAAASA